MKSKSRNLNSSAKISVSRLTSVKMLYAYRLKISKSLCCQQCCRMEKARNIICNETSAHSIRWAKERCVVTKNKHVLETQLNFKCCKKGLRQILTNSQVHLVKNAITFDSSVKTTALWQQLQ